MNAMFFSVSGKPLIDQVYDADTQAILKEKLHFLDGIYARDEWKNRADDCRKVEVLFSTWGMIPFTEEDWETYFPNVKAVFYGAGSVQFFARAAFAKGIRVFSAAAANAVPVAEFTTAQIVLANKGYFQATAQYSRGEHDPGRAHSNRSHGNYNAKIGIIGAGMIGKLVIGLLKAYHLSVMVFDPFLPQGKADELGVTLCDLPTLFSECQIISNHLANNAQTKGMLNYSLFSRMKKNATFINTGRGAQVVEEDLVRALKEEPDRTALLDVTDPEPVEPGHPFFEMPNVFLSPHIAGSMNHENARMGRYMAEECLRWLEDQPTRYEVTEPMLATMA
ncbi:MAG: NAD(P)-dependent oxidoreductase [Acutalibacteraceae bacterium]